MRMLAATGQFGATYSLSPTISASTLVHTDDGRLDGRGSGALSLGIGATVLALSARHEHPLGAGWNVSARATIAVDTPGAGARMVEATPALLSAWEAALVQRTETLQGYAHRAARR